MTLPPFTNNVVDRLRHTLAAFEGSPDDREVLTATNDGRGNWTGLTLGDLRRLSSAFRDEGQELPLPPKEGYVLRTVTEADGSLFSEHYCSYESTLAAVVHEMSQPDDDTGYQTAQIDETTGHAEVVYTCTKGEHKGWKWVFAFTTDYLIEDKSED